MHSVTILKLTAYIRFKNKPQNGLNLTKRHRKERWKQYSNSEDLRLWSQETTLSTNISYSMAKRACLKINSLSKAVIMSISSSFETGFTIQNTVTYYGSNMKSEAGYRLSHPVVARPLLKPVSDKQSGYKYGLFISRTCIHPQTFLCIEIICCHLWII